MARKTKTGAPSVTASWEAIEAWLGKSAPHLLARLPAGAADAALARAEAELGVQLPEALQESWRRHDGTGGVGLFDHDPLLSLAQVVERWRTMTDLLRAGAFEGLEVQAGEGVRACWWSARWVPITSDAAGDGLCVDLDATSAAGMGQVIQVWSDDDEREAVAPSFAAWLAEYAKELRGKRLGLSDNDTVGEV